MSTKEQADGATLGAQKDAITAFASQNNLLVTKWFEEQETASKAGRPLFEDMRQQLLRGLAETAVPFYGNGAPCGFQRLRKAKKSGLGVLCGE